MVNSKSRSMVAAVISALLFTLLFAAFSVPRSGFAAPAAQAAPPSVTIPAGGTATLKVRGFCLAFGLPFPTGNMTANGLANISTRNALTYAIQKGYTDNNAAQVQEAVWFLQDNTWHNTDHATGQEIVDNAASVGTIPTGTGTALNDPAAQNVLSMTAVFVPQTPDAFYGDGDLKITNNGTTEINVYVPIGMKFTVPNSSGAFQDLVAYALQADNGTPTAGATAAATGTVGATSVATATTAVATAAATSTTEATVAVAATATVEATATTEVMPTATQAPVATATTVTAAPLPTTGSTEDSIFVLFVLFAVACSLVGFGVLMRLRHR